MRSDVERPSTPYALFLWYANMASRVANDDQRLAIRALAAQQLTPEENSAGICTIMGWES